jgi:hypothetical protein
MKALLEQAGREFLKAFGVSVVVLAPGVLQAPNLDQSFLLGVAALFASFSAGLKVLQGFVPRLSVSEFVKQPYAAWSDAFLRGGLAALFVSLVGILDSPDLSNWKAAATAALVGAVAAGFRALEGALTKGETPFVDAGLK